MAKCCDSGIRRYEEDGTVRLACLQCGEPVRLPWLQPADDGTAPGEGRHPEHDPANYVFDEDELAPKKRFYTVQSVSNQSALIALLVELDEEEGRLVSVAQSHEGDGVLSSPVWIVTYLHTRELEIPQFEELTSGGLGASNEELAG